MSAEEEPPAPRDLEKSYAAVQAMIKHAADRPPAIIHMLRVLLDPASFPPGHAKWVEDGARAILKNWEHSEDPEQLESDLGLTGPKRRKALTVRRETTIAANIVDAALAGVADPKKVVAENLAAAEPPDTNADIMRRVQRAWKTWGTVYLARLSAQESLVSPEDGQRIRAAIDRLTTKTKS